MKNLVLSLMILLMVCACSKTNQLAKIGMPETEFNFGSITTGDTVTKVFKLQNISDTPLRIEKVGTSCGCTGAIVSDSIISKNQFAEIKVTYSPKEGDTGPVKNSIVIEANTEPNFTVFYLTGTVTAFSK